jgi:hypothetical protein
MTGQILPKEQQALLQLALCEYHYRRNEFDLAARSAGEALGLVQGELQDNHSLLEVYRQLVRIYLCRHEYNKILEYGIKTLELA